MVDSGTIGRPIIIFVHDVLQTWRTWLNQLQSLHLKYRTIAIDLRGHGLSEKKPNLNQYSLQALLDDLHDLVFKLKSECICMQPNRQNSLQIESSHCDCTRQPILICGVGLGGTLAWLMACDSKSKIDKVISIAAPHPVAHLKLLRNTPYLWFTFLFNTFVQLPLVPEMFLTANDFDSLNRIYQRQSDRSLLLDRLEMQHLKASLSQPTALTHALSVLRSNDCFKHSIWQKSESQVPTLMMMGELDRLNVKRLNQESLYLSKRTQLIVLDQCSRYAHLDQILKVNNLIDRFLENNNNNDNHFDVQLKEIKHF